VVEWGQVTLNTPYIHAQDEPVDRSDNIENQSNHDLIVLTSKHNFDEDSVHETPADNVLDDDHESELEQGNQEEYDNMIYENQGAESEGESVLDSGHEHEQNESNDTQEYAEDIQDDEPDIEEINASVHEPHINNDQRTEDETNEPELIEREQGATYNLRDRLMLQAPRRLLEVMDNPHSTKAYETPTILLQSVLDHVTGGYGTENGYTDSKDVKSLVFGKLLTQMTAKAGIKMYGEKA